MARHGRRRRRSRAAWLPVVAWSVVAAIVLVVALLATGRSWTFALGLAAGGVIVVFLATALVEATGALSRRPEPPPSPTKLD